MNKFALSIAVIALINNVSAIRMRDDDLFNDDNAELETLASIQAAEKLHGAKFTGLNAEDQKNLISQKSEMHFDQNDEFIKNDKRTYNKVLLQTGAEINYSVPEARPIYELLAQIGSGKTAEDYGKILAGSQLNDEDDEAETLASLKSAEAAMGTKMNAPQVKKEFYKNTGSQVENLLAQDFRINKDMLNLDDVVKETKSPHRIDVEANQKKLAEMEEKRKKNMKEQESMAVHFTDNGFSEEEMG